MFALKTVIVCAFVGVAVAFQSSPMFTTRSSSSTVMTMSAENNLPKIATAAALAAFTGLSAMAPSTAITSEVLRQLSYEQVKGTGLANRCPDVVGEDTISISGKKKLVDMCIEPKIFQVKEGSEYVNTKLMTRQTYTLDGIDGDIKMADGKIQFTEKDGIDYSATTVQLPGGERVPFLFTVKELVAKATEGGSDFKVGLGLSGDFRTPSYRTGLFLDPKGRGGTTGYDMAVALPGIQNGEDGDEELYKENNKTFDVTDGKIEFQIQKVNKEEGEIGGVFVSRQKGDTDMGSKVPKDILLKGIFYARIE